MEEAFRLETERLCLRAYREEDVEDLAQMFGDPQHMRFYPAPFTRDQTRAWVSGSWRSGGTWRPA